MGFANRDEFDELDDFDDDEDEPGSFGRGSPACRYPQAGYSPPVEGPAGRRGLLLALTEVVAAAAGL